MDRRRQTLPPHVLVFPLPMQGHVNSMLKLVELLCLAGFHVTLLVSDYVQARLQRHASVYSRFSKYPGFWIRTISDGLPDDHPRTGKKTMDITMSLKVVGESQLRDLLVSTNCLSDGPKRRPVTCLIMDGVVGFAADVADELGIPFIYFRTVGACSFWANFCSPRVIDAGELPLTGKSDNELESMVSSVPGMEGYIRRRDLPGFFRVDNPADPGFQTISAETRKSTRAKALILNTFEDLEGPILAQIRTECPLVFSIGPLHLRLKTELAEAETTVSSSTASSGTFWEEDRSCVAWLDSHPEKSVIYVSFGSVTVVTKEQLLEFWHGLVNSGKRFLWVIRPDSIDEIKVPAELQEGTKDRGYIVGWAPQEEVLAHRAIGGFLTHSGWNSTLESIVAGIPMICWPYFADQMINSRFVEVVWKIGLDVKDCCDRFVIEKKVRELMDLRKDEFVQSANQMAELANKAIKAGGSSHSNLENLVELINSMVA